MEQAEIDIEKEVQARVDFKLNEFMTGIKNIVKWKYAQAFDMTQKSQYKWEAFQEFEALFLKEVCMGTPTNEMHKKKVWQAKEYAVNDIRKELEPRFRGRLRGEEFEMLIRKIVTAVEKAQKF